MFSLTVPSVSAPRVRTNTALRRSHIQYRLHTLSLVLSLSLAGARALSPPAFSAAECVCYWWCQEILLNCFESQQLQSQAHILTLKNPHMRQRLNIWIGFSIFFLITHAKMWKYYGNIEYLFQLFGVLAFPIICYYVCAVCLKVWYPYIVLLLNGLN